MTNSSLLSSVELIAFDALKGVSNESLWGIAIKEVMNRPSVSKFRQLISDLISQDEDDPGTMKNILGDAYESVVSLKEVDVDENSYS